jgi:hypothetical protein
LFTRRSELVLVGRDGSGRKLDGESAELVRAILDFLHAPRTRAEIIAHLERLSDGPIERPAVIDEALALLTQAHAVEELSAAPPPPVPARGRLLLGISGAVAAAGTPALATRLSQLGFEVRVAMTPTAARFVSARVLEAITHAPVASSLWRREPEAPVPHIRWAEWAELVLICPASATTIARLCAGDCAELVAAIVTATRAPVLIVPSMNAAMYASPAVQRNLEQLRADGRYVLGSGAGEELAQAPGERTALGGAMPSWTAIADVAVFVAAERARPDWDALYAGEGAPPFCADRFDPDIGEALAQRRITSGRVIDCGTGTGTIAIELARRGFAVSAVDGSRRALARARARAGSDRVKWIERDLLAGRPELRSSGSDTNLISATHRRGFPSSGSDTNPFSATDRRGFPSSGSDTNLNSATDRPELPSSGSDINVNSATDRPELPSSGSDINVNSATDRRGFPCSGSGTNLNAVTNRPELSGSGSGSDVSSATDGRESMSSGSNVSGATDGGRSGGSVSDRTVSGVVDDDNVNDDGFDIAIDRGCVHGLPPAQHASWAATMARLVRAGGWLLLKTLAPIERCPSHTHAFTVEELSALLGEHFVLEDSWQTVFHGPLSPPPRALFSVFRRLET